MHALLKILEDGHFHSGEEMGAALGIGRSAVWKQLQRLQAELGIPLQKVRGRGYRLATVITPLQPDRIDSPWPVEILPVIDSTNAEAMRRLRKHSPLPLVLLAEQQTGGRGRRGRQWVSPYGENLYYSLAMDVTEGAAFLEGLSLVVSLAVVEALQDYDLPSLGVKWPNDVLLDGRKLCGILLELSGDPADICHVVIGIGLNVNMRRADSIEQPWISLREALGRPLDRSVLVTKLGHALKRHIDRHRTQGFSISKIEWEAVHLWQNAFVELSSGDRTIRGKVLGIDDKGALRLAVGCREQSFSGGELSLRLQHDS